MRVAISWQDLALGPDTYPGLEAMVSPRRRQTSGVGCRQGSGKIEVVLQV